MMESQCEAAPAAESFSREAGYNDSGVSGREERMIAYTVSLQLEVDDAAKTRAALGEYTKSFGGYVTREYDTYVAARVPAASMDAFLAQARTLGKVANEVKTGNDITDQYRDDLLRLESLKNIRARYQALLEKAGSVADMLNIEKEIERIDTQIEVLEGRGKYAEQSVSYSHISVSFEKETTPGPIGWIFYGLYQGIKWLFVW
jgi:hypothetical protein